MRRTMQLGRAPLRPAAAAAVAIGLALAASAGCGSDSTPTGLGDLSGLRLGVFASDRDQSPGQYDLYLWDYDALRFRDLPTVLRTTAAERHPSISSDGRFIAFQVDRGTGGLDDIEMFDRLQAKFIALPGLNTPDPESEPVFTGDGLKLCFVQGSSVRRIRMYDGQKHQLVALPGLADLAATYSDYSPAPNRTGSLIAFVSDRSGNPDIWLYDMARSQVFDIPELRSAGADVDPCFTPSGNLLAFSSNRGGGLGGYDLFLLEFQTLPPETVLLNVSIANTTSDERHPSLSESGNIIVFQSNRPEGLGRWDVWNFDRVRGLVGQARDYASAGDDIEPSIKWPN